MTARQKDKAPPAATHAPLDTPAKKRPRLKIEVDWASIEQAIGDIYVVGHYIGVLPQNAERALDRALSGVQQGTTTSSDDGPPLILTELTRRGAIRGALGEVIYFPWKDRGHVALAGMGRLGTFKQPQLRTLAAGLTQSISRLMPDATLCTVLIGTGVGNLTVAEAVPDFVGGIASTLAAEPAGHTFTLRIVERKLDRACEILALARKAASNLASELNIEIEVAKDLDLREGQDSRGGTIPTRFGFSLMMASLAQASLPPESGKAGHHITQSLDALVSELPKLAQDDVRKALAKLGVEQDRKQLGLSFRLLEDESLGAKSVADRISFTHDGASIQSAAITNLTTVATRTLEVSSAWIDRIVEVLRAPNEKTYLDRGRRAFKTLVHPDLRSEFLLFDPLVLELDRTMARLPWELIHDNGNPLAILRPVARQLRTAYSPRNSDLLPRTTWKALVIGDPDDSLPSAKEEAKAVKAALDKCGLQTDLRIGKPDNLGLGSEPDIEPADLYEILELMQTGDYDVVHFAGHADFDPRYPDRSGWIFSEGTLTAAKLEGVDRVPRLIVANACLSASVSNFNNAAAPAAEITATRRDFGLVASLADEFFRRGVADYIGTAWEVPDAPAKEFAATLYARFFENAKTTTRRSATQTTQLGQAVQSARLTLFNKRDKAGPAWAAYQHYGDPMRTVSDYRG